MTRTSFNNTQRTHSGPNDFRKRETDRSQRDELRRDPRPSSMAFLFFPPGVLIIPDRDLISYDNHRRATEHSHTCKRREHVFPGHILPGWLLNFHGEANSLKYRFYSLSFSSPSRPRFLLRPSLLPFSSLSPLLLFSAPFMILSRSRTTSIVYETVKRRGSA